MCEGCGTCYVFFFLKIHSFLPYLLFRMIVILSFLYLFIFVLCVVFRTCFLECFSMLESSCSKMVGIVCRSYNER
jgi:hypothetical protein